jgi:hypothetical protein
MQHFYTIDLVMRITKKFVSSILEPYFSSYEINKYLIIFWKNISETLFQKLALKC